ncbi:hypothetical protein COV82_04690 [Candidatus Peregrinibacteria bacterium CG11_big_fil_rev_8_21_14_0_20_46_8]|nr:MAG: hypothetical protein COV82_04690 [Candidatus Peregrinibacteria bacterium CG11_big_fil_rev_8_21_14_0_20_46_8]
MTLRVGKFFLFFSLTFLIGLISFLYLLKFTEIHTKGYEVRKLELQRDQLLSEREAQRKDIESLKSLQSIRQGTSYLIPARKTTFVHHETGFALAPKAGGLH